MSIEACVDSVESSVAAENGGAERIELCAALLEGRLTPSAGAIAFAREKIGIGLHVIIRPRGGDFLYTHDEHAVMLQDIDAAKNTAPTVSSSGCSTPTLTSTRRERASSSRARAL